MIFEAAAWLGLILLGHSLQSVVMFGHRGDRPDRSTRLTGALGVVLVIVGLGGVLIGRLLGR